MCPGRERSAAHNRNSPRNIFLCKTLYRFLQMPFPELEMWIGSECSKALFHNAAVPLAFYQKIILSVGLLIPVAPGTGVAVNRKRLDVLLVLGWEWQRVKAPKKRSRWEAGRNISRSHQPGRGSRTGVGRVHPQRAAAQPGAPDWDRQRRPCPGLRAAEGRRWAGGELKGPRAGSPPSSHPASQLSRTFDPARDKTLSAPAQLAPVPPPSAPQCDLQPAPQKRRTRAVLFLALNHPLGTRVLCDACGLSHLRAQVCRWPFTEGCRFASDLATQK